MKDGFLKVAACSPALRVADCGFNARCTAEAAADVAASGARLAVMPELGITGYTCGDLFGQRTLLEGALEALNYLCEATRELDMVLVVGLPLEVGGKLYNCAAVLLRGQVLGVVPKSHLPNHGEFYERRKFCPAPRETTVLQEGPLAGVPFGTQLLFACREMPEFVLAVEICEDLWVPVSPSAAHCIAGATVIANLSASNEIVGKVDYRQNLVQGQSGRLVCGYVYADAGFGESSTDMVFAGQDLVAENGLMLADSGLFGNGAALADIDLQRIAQDRMRLSTYPAPGNSGYAVVPFSLTLAETPVHRHISPAPFVPNDTNKLAERCEIVLSIQAEGLRRRLEHTGCRTALVGISGGLDSALAMLVVARAFRASGRPAHDILAITMPGFGTSRRTLGNAGELCAALDATLKTIDVTDTVRMHFKDIGHDETQHDTTYENAQARMRTLILMDLANKENGLVIGTGDLSELALGWATYSGDHMSMYGVNASVPKTLVRHLVAYEAGREPTLTKVLRDILATPVSPELLPAENGEISQQTEDLIGPYELHDFFLYYVLRWGFAPAKVLRLAKLAFAGRYPEQEQKKWLVSFYRRFFAHQFKRSCLPDGPKVGSVSLSPRGDWRMPSDAVATLWLKELELL